MRNAQNLTEEEGEGSRLQSEKAAKWSGMKNGLRSPTNSETDPSESASPPKLTDRKPTPLTQETFY